MSENTKHFDVPPSAVWNVLADGWTYADWVVGAAKIRDVDPNWPAVGTKIHHTVGVLPIHIKDNTESVEMREGEYLRLRARVRPIGTARISFELRSSNGGTDITMIEVVDRGFAAKLYGRVMRGAIHARNIETLRRLENLAKERAA